ncbi:hypothetical protein ACIHEJ_32630 [Streptomyces sp. NPDC052301]|uniref:hypothetical protein n=1 Tax=Streptomyces sp. NPDC052301 TaxID=3365687 RepID=UPI0037D6C0CE
MVCTRLPAIPVGAALFLALPPAAHATPGTPDDACAAAVAAADEAEHDYEACKKELQDRIADGGHPDRSELQALADAEAQADATASQAQRACGS